MDDAEIPEVHCTERYRANDLHMHSLSRPHYAHLLDMPWEIFYRTHHTDRMS